MKVGRFVRHRDTIIVSICCAQSTSSSVRFALVCEETRIALVWFGFKCPNLAKSKTHIGDVYVRFALVCKETSVALVFKFSNLAKSKTHIGDVYVRFALVCRGGQQAFPVAHLSGCFALATAMAWHFQHSSSKVPEVTPPGWLEWTRWQGMPYHVTLGLPKTGACCRQESRTRIYCNLRSFRP